MIPNRKSSTNSQAPFETPREASWKTIARTDFSHRSRLGGDASPYLPQLPENWIRMNRGKNLPGTARRNFAELKEFTRLCLYSEPAR